jgi:hypothetical protein
MTDHGYASPIIPHALVGMRGRAQSIDGVNDGIS